MVSQITLTSCGADRVDWGAPWLTDLQSVVAPILFSEDFLIGFNMAAERKMLSNHRGSALHFVPQSSLPVGTPYELFISETGYVPTRDNLHDFFNALVWLAYPKIKRQLIALHAREIVQTSVISQLEENLKHTHCEQSFARGKLRDAATIFDENGALFVTTDSGLIELLRGHCWRELFVNRAAAFGRTCKVFLFGHALMEKLAVPYKAITAHAWIEQVESAFFELPLEEQRGQIDNIVGGQLNNRLAEVKLTPLPVLGIPGWSAQQDDAFYADQFVFRPLHRDIINC